MYLPIYLNNIIISQLPVYDDLAISWELMGANEIPAQIELPGPLYCPIGSYIIYNNQQYTINTIPSPQITGDANGLKYTYNIVFESYLYRLYDKGFKYLNNKTFTFYGDLQSFCYLIVQNINSIDADWSVGFTDDMGLKSIDFDKHTCRTAIDAIAEAFGCEWYLSGTGKTINFVKQAGSLTTLVFQYGRGKGLYSLGYQYQDNENIVTRAFGYGSTKNLPKNYRNGATELMFDGFYIEKNVYKNDDPAQGFLYRVKEGDYIDEDIFPSIAGVVSGVSAFDATSGVFTITDTTLDFDLNTYFSSDTPKVSFTSGQLQGQNFDISTYDNTTKVIKVKITTDAAGNNLPSAVINPVVGDTYTLIDMYMPAEKVTAAEALLKSKTQDWLIENCIPRVLYNLELDPLYARDNGIMLKPGDQITVQHDALGINSLIRVTSISYPVNFPGIITPNTKITATIANFIPYTTTERVVANTIDNQKDIKIVDRTNAENARIAALNLKKLQGRIFNPDGSLFTGTDSLVAGMATFGYDSENFNLNNVTISPNHGADPNALTISAGELVHRTYKVDGLGYIWAVDANGWSGLDSLKFYYVYAKCSKTSLSGTWQISETPVSVNDIVGNYAFNLGILYEVNSDGYRDFEFTKGMTYIVGDQITTGTIKDLSGENYINLNEGSFNFGNAPTGNGFSYNADGDGQALINAKVTFGAGSTGYENIGDKPDLSGIAVAQEDASEALANASNAQATANAVAEVTTFLNTTVDGNVIATGILLVGDAIHSNAGITGVTDNGVSSLRFWAGATYANRYAAPFMVFDNGGVVMNNCIVSGKITSKDGLIGNWTIDSYGLINSSTNDAYVTQTKTFAGTSDKIVASIGTGMTSEKNAVASFTLDHSSGQQNVALYARALYGTGPIGFSNNIAGWFEGDFIINSEGSVQVVNLPHTSTLAGFGQVVIQNGTNKLYVL
jgi:hypothetical protein